MKGIEDCSTGLSADQKNTYCRKLFKNIYIEKHATGLAKISPCCISGAGPATDSIDFHGNEALVRARQQSLNGSRVPECHPCWDREDQGQVSQREIWQDDDPYRVELQSIDYNVSPICNARCIICSSVYSSAWAQEDAKFNFSPPEGRSFAIVRQNTVDTDLDLSHINRIYFNGGEPMLSQEPMEILTRIKHTQGTLANLCVSLNTNGSILPSDEIVSLWCECRQIQINFSLDACGPEFGYIRFPLEWQSVVDNIQHIIQLKLPHLKICVATVVGIHNFLEMPALHDWIKHLSKNHVHDMDWGVHPAFGVFGLNGISDDLKIRVKSTPLHIEQQDLIHSFVDHPQNWGHGDWLGRLEQLDKRRGLDWRTSLPKLAEFLGVKKSPA